MQKPLLSILRCILLFLSIAGLLPLTASAQKKQTAEKYTIAGDIEGLNNDSVVIFIQHEDYEGKIAKTDTLICKARGNKFSATGNVKGTQMASARLGGLHSQKSFSFFLEKGSLLMKGKMKDAEEINITGTPNNDLYTAQNDHDRKIYAQIKPLYAQMRGLPDTSVIYKQLDARADVLRDSINQSWIRFIGKNPNSPVSGIYLYVLSDRVPLEQLENLYDKVGDNVKGSGHGLIVKRSIEGKIRTQIGKQAPAFTSTDTSGSPVSLSSFKGKYVLLDFWASWCVPCRAESPYLRAAYKKYSDKGFVIISYSMDDKADKWKAAIRQDQLDWVHLSDLKAFDNPVSKLYGVQPIPDNFLIDPDGKIIARGLRGDDVDKTLSGIFGAQTAKKGYVINGTTAGIQTGTIYLSEFIINGKRDSAIIKNGKFSFSGSVKESIPCILSLERNYVNKAHLLFFLDNSQVFITVDSNIGKSKVTGSASNDDYVVYTDKTKDLDSLAEKLYRLRALYLKDTGQKKLYDSTTKIAETNETEIQKARQVFIETHPSSAVSAWLAARYFMYDADVSLLEKMYTGFDAGLRKTSDAEKIREHIEIGKRTAIGQPALDFTQNDTLGNPVSLKNFRGRYVLLDFWASWCGPCRMANPGLVRAFKKYNGKGFTILSVSLDREGKKQNWMDAIHKDGLTWTHVSDLKFWDNAVSKLYGIIAVPTNFLIDPSGSIVARDVQDEDLDKKLGEIYSN